MKKFKLLSLVVIIGLVALMIYQNQTYFFEKHGLDFNFYFSQYQTPETANVLYWFGCFAIGFLISFFFSLLFRFKAQKKIKLQNQTIENYRETVQELKKEIEKIKASGYLNVENRSHEEDEDYEDESNDIIEEEAAEKA